METETTDHGTLETWTPQEVRDAFQRNEIVLIDVRTPQEYGFERIDGALLAPMQAFDPDHMPGQSDKHTVFHCGSGVRSEKVARLCLEHGFERVAHLGGGFGAWKDSGIAYTGTDVGSGAPKSMQKTATS